jgi:hypothetical protein
MIRFERFIGLGIAVAVSAVANASEPATQPAVTKPTTMPSSVLEPVHESATQPADQAAEMREGTLIDLTGQIIYNTKHEPMFRFHRAEGGDVKTLPLLPNQNLEKMEDALATNGKDIWFRVSVVLTVYMNHNYLLVHDASLLLEKP